MRIYLIWADGLWDYLATITKREYNDDLRRRTILKLKHISTSKWEAGVMEEIIIDWTREEKVIISVWSLLTFLLI